jgi:hypothetical protein
MTQLGIVSVAVGALVIAVRAPGVIAPARFREFSVKFPRSLLWGRVLMGIAAAIAWYVMYHAATDEWKWAQPLILFGVPVAYGLVFLFPPNFLALRASAALMLMIAKQMVDAADLSEMPSRLIVTTLAYLWVVAAIWLAAAPHQYRDLLGCVMANDKRCRAVCGVGALVGVFLVALGLLIYR